MFSIPYYFLNECFARSAEKLQNTMDSAFSHLNLKNILSRVLNRKILLTSYMRPKNPCNNGNNPISVPFKKPQNILCCNPFEWKVPGIATAEKGTTAKNGTFKAVRHVDYFMVPTWLSAVSTRISEILNSLSNAWGTLQNDLLFLWLRLFCHA